MLVMFNMYIILSGGGDGGVGGGDGGGGGADALQSGPTHDLANLLTATPTTILLTATPTTTRI